MRDPYSVLGVKREASADEIKRAFRRLAKAYHPDRKSEDPKAQERFNEANTAYEILGDDTKRKAFDRGEIDAEGKPRATASPGFDPAGFGGGQGGFRFDTGGGPYGAGGRGDPRDIFSDLFRQFETGGQNAPRGGYAGAGTKRSTIPPGEDAELEALVALEDVAAGGSKRITVPDGRTIEVSVPKGVTSGTTMRLKGQGHPSPFGGANGDCLVTLRFARHARFAVEGQDLRASVPVPLRDAVLGGTVRVPTLQGEVEVTVPIWTSGGKTLRLREKGLPGKGRTGDLFITLEISLGPQDPELEGFFRRKKN